MTFAGKKLQEIYDGASQELSKIESDVSNRLTTIVGKHTESRDQNEQESNGKIKQTSTEIENELRKLAKESTDRLEHVIRSEVKETEDHVKSIITDMTVLTNNLKSTIVDLRESYEENVQHLCSGLLAQYEGTVEEARIEVEMQDYASSKQLKSHGTFMANSLQQKLDHILWETRGNEKQASGTLFKTFMQKANQIDTHFSQLMKQLSGEFQGHFQELEEVCHSGESGLDGELEGLNGEIERIAAEVEEQVRSGFSTSLEDQSRTLDNSLNATANDLSALHEATTDKLTQLTNDLKSNLSATSEKTQTNLNERCSELESYVDSLLQAFSQRLEVRLNESVSLKQNLEHEKDDIFGGILNDLKKTKEGFEKQLRIIASEAVAKLNKSADNAEKEITDIQTKSQMQLHKEFDSAQADIEHTLKELLDCAAQQRNNALAEITKAVSSTSSKPDSPRSQNPLENLDI